MLATLPLLRHSSFPALQRDALQTLQVNLGYRCNQQCVHCHVNASPKRRENMDRETCEQILLFLAKQKLSALDLTGGAPELNPHFRYLVQAARQMGMRVIDRCNLTILSEPEQTDLATFLAAQQVEITASLPCYLEHNVDKQRGKGTFQRSIEGLQQLNALGYGQPDTSLQLNLVYNPQNPVLPPPQASLEANYKDYLHTHYGIVFNQLFTLCNMPIQRFGSMLISTGQFGEYMTTLHRAYEEANTQVVMCRTLISIDWQGYVYDCDFNQMLDLPLHWQGRHRRHISELYEADLLHNPIQVADHCYACTAGQGSSCGGALS